MEPKEILPPPPPLPPGHVAQKCGDVAGSSSSGPGAGGNGVNLGPSGTKPTGPPSNNPSTLAVAALPKYVQMQRKGRYGTKGAAVTLECNHFKVKFEPRADVYHYNVTIEPSTKKVVSRKIMAKLYETYGKAFLGGKRFAYDGEKSLFTVGPLDFNSHEFPIHLEDEPGRGPRRHGNARSPDGSSPTQDGEAPPAQRRRIGGRDFTVNINFSAVVSMSVVQKVLGGERDEKAQDALRVLDIVLREHAARRDYLLIRDSYFHNTIGVGDIGEGVQSWKGFHVSFRPTSGGCLTLNFDLSTTTVIKPTDVLVFLQDYCKKDIRQFRDADWQKARRILKGIQVDTYSGRRQKISGFSSKPCNQLSFEKKLKNHDGQPNQTVEVTVADYFQTERNMTLMFPNLPALDVGRASKPVYLPIELCKIVAGQRYKKSLSGVQRKNHIDYARENPDERKKKCKEAMQKNNYNDDELVKEFNVRIDQNMATVKGRVLEPPSLLFGNREERPVGGRWNFNAKKMKLAVKIDKWAVANFSRFPVAAVAKQLREVCMTKGMVLSEAHIFEEQRQMINRGPQERVDNLLGQMRTLEPLFVLAVLPEKSSELYAPFKKMCATKIGVVTQCIVPPRNVKDQYLTNVALKINLKWGGYNTLLSHEEKKTLPRVSQVPTCVFGLDVSHGSPGDANSPSIAAAVASMNWPNFSKYIPRVRAQAPKTEMIEGLYEDVGGKHGGMVMELLFEFFKTCEMPGIEQRKPQQIVIYRDGVSESQFDQVLEIELTAFKRACEALGDGYNPRMTLIVVQKRHHTRFFPQSGGNVKPGTIVDRDVCHPRDNDFFLCSHAGLIGTSRPTHYHVLYDEIGFTTDELQHLTHCLCYSYARCTTAVSVVAPAYYAHLAAQHCRNFVDNDGSGSETSSMTGKPGRTVTPLPKISSKLLRSMFYT